MNATTTPIQGVEVLCIDSRRTRSTYLFGDDMARLDRILKARVQRGERLAGCRVNGDMLVIMTTKDGTQISGYTPGQQYRHASFFRYHRETIYGRF